MLLKWILSRADVIKENVFSHYFFRSCSFMIIILMPDCTQRSVIKAINDLTEALGIRTFKKYFPVILTDNGSEFKNPWDIEKTESGNPQNLYILL